VQYTTGCTFGKGNIRKQPHGKLAFTLIDKDSHRAVRVSYKPTLQKQIAASTFMQKRAAGIMPDDIPEAEQMELVDLVWNAPEEDVLTVGEVFEYAGEWYPEVMVFVSCAGC
jgi:formylmethanofuran dehydrogenase subunit E